MLPGLNLAPTYRIAKNFKGENFHEFRVFVAICESLLREIWGGGVVSFGRVKGHNPRKFLP